MSYADILDIVWTVFPQHLTVYPIGLVVGYSSLSKSLRCCSWEQEFAMEYGGSYLMLTFGLLRSMVLFGLLAEVWFYYMHRALHHPSVYKHFHKKHHKFTAPISAAALYFHPVESVINFGVVAPGPLLFGCHIYVFYAWLSMAVFLVQIHHCGFELPGYKHLDDIGFGSMTLMHDIHHQKFDTNYGVLGILDWAHGTLDMVGPIEKDKKY